MLESGWVSRYEVVIPAGSAMIAVVSVYNRTNVYLIHSMSNEILITTLISNTTDIALVPYQEARYIAFRHQDSSTTIRVEAWSGYATVKKR